ncbi:putative putative membrane-located cell surface saccharide saccharide acetylase [Roseovarius sp. TM1035]|uniref:acyltransferase family protein n=1 Tax=Roseovarius sp. TM1035 TaxID=391613 RepID=UPI0001556E91|nr:acyltransferase family protein [Roseovarius sp. TM1035]EDM31870.1 putative putative membrane-located cell surface saccharide saccharide acetylase [Roseovarius sp. TM1035]
MKYRPEIDGLRAIAILPVVFYHAGVTWFPGGFVGVDVFFVISGYLITSIILSERAAGNFTLTGFYGRRIRRIFPALFVMMAVSYPIAWALLDPSAMAEFSGSIAASTVFFANVYFLEVSGYFATAAEFKPLLHNWSLSVEEQFYLIFPMAVLLTWRAGAKWQVRIFMAVALLSLALAQWQIARGNEARAFFLLYARLWELLVGVLIAYWLTTPQGAALRDGGRFRHGALLGLALILWAVFTYDTETAFPGLAALLPCVGAALVIAFAKGQSLIGQVLGWRPVVFVGLVSYSLYLWHVPALVFTRIGTGREDLWLMLAACALAFALACLSWRYVERPFRRMHALPPLRLFGTAAACMVVLGGLGLLGQETDGFRAHYLEHRLDPVTRANYERYSPTATRSRVADDGCRFRDEELTEEFGARLQDCAARHGPGIFILGDSHAENVYNALRSTERFPFLVGLTRGGCRPYQYKAKCSYEAAIPFLTTYRDSVAQVVFHVSGSHYILDHRNEGDSDAAFEPGTEGRIAEENVTLTSAYLAKLPEGLDVVWLGPFAEARVDLSNPGNYSTERLQFNPVALAHFDRLEARLKSEAEGQTAYRYLSLLDALDFGPDALLQGDCLTFWDVDHFSPCGERLFGPTIADLVLSKAPLTQ